MTIRVLIADDQVMIRDGLAALLTSASDIEVVGQAVDGQEAVAMARELRPDVIVMDIRMPTMDGLAATEKIVGGAAADGARGGAPDDTPGDTPGDAPKVLVLTTFDLDEYVYEALGAGASVWPPPPPRGLISVSPRRRRHERPRPDALAALTPRETDVLRLIARGMSNMEIAGELFLAEQTVKTHVGHVLTKLGLRDRTHAVVFAYENGLAG